MGGRERPYTEGRTGEVRPTPSHPSSGFSSCLSAQRTAESPQTVYSYVFAKVWPGFLLAYLEERTCRWRTLSLLLCSLKRLSRAYSNEALTCLGPAEVPTPQSGGRKGWFSPFAQTMRSGALWVKYGADLWKVSRPRRPAKSMFPEDREMPRWLQ